MIGLQYLVCGFVFYLIGGALAGAIRTELTSPVSDFMARDVYNQVLTLHGTVMIFLWIVPVVNGAFGNYLIPFYVGARDMAFPRLNAVAFWLIPPAGLMLITSYFLTGAAQSGWTAYPPLSITTPATGQIIWILSVLLLGGSSIFGGINFIATILKLRRPGLKLMQLPMYCWAMLGTSILVVLSTPVLAGTLVLLSFDIVAHTGFFNPTLGGNVVVYQHLFWFYSHPAVYIMVLPAFGLVSEILPVHARKPLFGYVTMVYSIMAIVVLGLIVWAHHMFTSGTPPWMRLVLHHCNRIHRRSHGIKFFNWLQHSGGAHQPQQRHAVFLRFHRELRARRHHRGRPGAGAVRHSCARHLLRGRPFPLHHGRRGGRRLLRRAALLVAEDDRADVLAAVGQDRRGDDLLRLQPDLLPAVPARLSRHAAALSRLSRGLPVPPCAVLDGGALLAVGLRHAVLLSALALR